jgi:hypothetical protein
LKFSFLIARENNIFGDRSYCRRAIGQHLSLRGGCQGDFRRWLKEKFLREDDCLIA